MAAAHFDVVVSGTTGSVEDWKKALNAPESELPQLTSEQKEIAQKMGIPEQEYARGVLVGHYGETRQRERGEKLGYRVAEVLQGLGPEYTLSAVIREGTKLRWVIRVRAPKGETNIAVPLDLADDVIDSGTVQDLERLRRLLLESLDRKDLLTLQ